MSRYPLTDPMAEIPVAEAERFAAFRKIELQPALEGDATSVSLTEGAEAESLFLFLGSDRDDRLFLARVAVTFPHLRTDLDKPKRKPGLRRPVRRSPR